MARHRYDVRGSQVSDLPAGKHCLVASLLYQSPAGELSVAADVIAGVDHPYVSSSDLRAEAAMFMASDEGVALVEKAKRLGCTLLFATRERTDPLRAELAAQRRAHRVLMHGE